MVSLFLRHAVDLTGEMYESLAPSPSEGATNGQQCPLMSQAWNRGVTLRLEVRGVHFIVLGPLAVEGSCAVRIDPRAFPCSRS
jgi:hypothetical protein